MNNRTLSPHQRGLPRLSAQQQRLKNKSQFELEAALKECGSYSQQGKVGGPTVLRIYTKSDR